MTERFDALVIGGGMSGLPLALRAAKHGSVALIEKELLGGTFLNRGCIPTKTMIASADIAHAARTARRSGCTCLRRPWTCRRSWTARTTSSSRSARVRIAPLSVRQGLEFIEGVARFVGDDVVEVGGARIEADKIFLNTLSRRRRPPSLQRTGTIMSSCCSTDQSMDPTACPRCGATGPVIGAQPVLPHRPDAADGPWQHCASADCPVVYYLADAALTTDHLRTQVAHKALDKPTPVCFCFSHTADDLAVDLEAHDGVSAIKADIKTAVAEGFCACEHLNVSGKCCLADIHRTLKSITAPATERV